MKKIRVSRQQAADHIFKPLYGLLYDLNLEQVNEVDGEVAIQISKSNKVDTWANAALYLHIWCVAFQSIAVKTKLSVDVDNLLTLAEKLQQTEIEIEEKLLVESRKELDGLKALWTRLPLNVINSGLRTLRTTVLTAIDPNVTAAAA